MQDLIRKLPGVLSTRVGYTGGDVPNATYRNHGTHAEGIRLSSIQKGAVIEICWSSSFRYTTRPQETNRGMTGGLATARLSISHIDCYQWLLFTCPSGLNRAAWRLQI